MEENFKNKFKGKNILLAEDIEVNRTLVGLFLEDTKVSIDEAENGLEAVEMFKAAPDKYNVILMDIQMPLLDGLSAARQIRASGLPNALTIPIIAMTGDALQEDVELSAQAGMNGYIVKPIDVPELLKALSDAIG